MKIKGTFEKIVKLKHSGLIFAAIIIGLFLIIFSDSFSGGIKTGDDTKIEKEIVELCTEIVNSKVYVAVNCGSDGTVSGVTVVLAAGDDANLKLKLTEAIKALCSVPSSKIYVTAPYSMNIR